jgi:hypothetical protein
LGIELCTVPIVSSAVQALVVKQPVRQLALVQPGIGVAQSVDPFGSAIQVAPLAQQPPPPPVSGGQKVAPGESQL